jgi:flagellar hook-associated protein 1 FlgK
MMAHQTALHVVGHNVANADTEGYSVQRANLKTSEPFGMPSLSSAGSVGQLGTGVLVDSITRARDVFLDGQIRKELSTINNYGAREQFLSEIETIFMEPSDTGLSTNLSKFWDAWNQLSTNPESSTARTLVVENADDLASSIRHNYEQLTDLEANAGDIIKNEIFETNSILTQIADLNEQIKSVVITGMQPNDLLDRRDLLLNQLSERFSFDVEQTDFQGIEIIPKGNGLSGSIITDASVNSNLSYISGVEKVTARTLKLTVYANGDSNLKKEIVLDLDSTDPDHQNLINSLVDIKYETNGTTIKNATLKTHTVFSTYDVSTGNLVLGNVAKFENGSINGNEAIKADILDYKARLNKLAKAIAVSVNTIHSNNSTNSTINATDSMNIFISNNENERYKNGTTVQSISEIEDMDEAAKYIQVNKKFIDNVSLLNAGKYGSGDGNGERALLIGRLRNIRVDIHNISRETFLYNNFNIDITTDPVDNSAADDLSQRTAKTKDDGFTIDSYFKDAVSKLGVDSQQAKRMITNQTALLNQLETRRESVSGVSLDEEMTNMIQFQRSYEANAKMISVIDQLLDVVVNGR